MNWEGCERKRSLTNLRHFYGLTEESHEKSSVCGSKLEPGTSRITIVSAKNFTETFGSHCGNNNAFGFFLIEQCLSSVECDHGCCLAVDRELS